ncbi:ComEC/Rec2 family competence protein [Engelhardtia mirabilis]|uniref:ComEC family competence protein n=1 Tax=Engelhardtia mirabilis TaxID=2528011 RepID=A0A518BI25_9BACT|nr:ComEC family competence protein [Planctomycetes bacterium Pla133]QDV00930.1 ComEC family competence protein [Planctomycetes bacterium Pla86]
MNTVFDWIERGLRARPALTTALVLAAGQAWGLEWVRLLGGAAAIWLVCCAALALGLAIWGRAAVLLALAGLLGSAARAAVDAPAPIQQGISRSVQLAEPVAGRIVAEGGQLRLRSDPPHPWLLEFEGPAPAVGSEVLLLPPGDLRAFVRGPEPGSVGRRGDLMGMHRVAIDELVRVSEPDRRPGGERIDGVRRALVERCEELGLDADRGLAGALLVGDRRNLDRDLADLFTRTGTRHLLALSGLHVGLLAAVVLWPLGALAARLARLVGVGARHSRLVADLARVAWLCGFALVAGAAPPVVRAALALGAILAARHLPGPVGVPWKGRQADALSIWGGALALECALDPRAVQSLSVALSYAATLGILLAATRLSSSFALRRGKERRTVAVLRWHRPLPIIAASIARDRLQAWFVTGVACSVAAVVATLPVAWNAFGEIAPVGILATVLSVPIIALLLPLLWLALWTGWVWVIHLTGALERGLIALLGLMDQLPGTPWLVHDRPHWLPWLATLTWFALLAMREATRLRLPTTGFALALTAVLVLPLRPGPRGLEVVALDVGHGTAVALRAPGSGTWIFDAGTRDRPRLVSEGLAPLMRAWEVQSVNLCLSHSDHDHRSAAPWIATRLEPQWHLGWTDDDLKGRSTRHLQLDGSPAGQARLCTPSGLELTLIRGGDGEGNEGSCSLLVQWSGRRVLLCGDAVDGGLAASLAAGHLQAPIDILLLPHHGSHGTAVCALLDQVEPREVWVSGAARPAMAGELDRRGQRWSSTGALGPLRAVLESAPRSDDNPVRWLD